MYRPEGTWPFMLQWIVIVCVCVCIVDPAYFPAQTHNSLPDVVPPIPPKGIRRRQPPSKVEQPIKTTCLPFFLN